ncbi:hypothetical protein ACP4OV_017078 [Aristida adscensionis]
MSSNDDLFGDDPKDPDFEEELEDFEGEALPMLVEWLKDVTVDAKIGGCHVSVPLLSQLTIQRDKQTGSTPLHLAASLNGWPFARFISTWFPHALLEPISRIVPLLDANTSCVYQPDNEGLYPIHVAAINGSRAVIKILLERCPDCVALQDSKGRTFIHIAVEQGRYTVVEYACSQMPQEFSSILNVQDNNGDTALHRAIHMGNLAVFNCLIRNRSVHLSIPNKDELTPFDLSWSKVPGTFYYGLNPRSVIQHSLVFIGASFGGSRPDLFSKKHLPISDEDKESKDLTDATQMMGIVSVLVATVTFASAFTLPGGYRSAGDGDAAGTPVLAGSYAFDAFILADALAFICSSLATFTLLYAGLPIMELSIRRNYLEISWFFLHASARSLVAAFALGLYLVLSPVAHVSAAAVCVIVSAAWLYGNLEAQQIFSGAAVARARFGIRRIPTLWAGLWKFLGISVLLPFWSFIIIFGLPAIYQRIKVHHTTS